MIIIIIIKMILPIISWFWFVHKLRTRFTIEIIFLWPSCPTVLMLCISSTLQPAAWLSSPGWVTQVLYLVLAPHHQPLIDDFMPRPNWMTRARNASLVLTQAPLVPGYLACAFPYLNSGNRSRSQSHDPSSDLDEQEQLKACPFLLLILL